MVIFYFVLLYRVNVFNIIFLLVVMFGKCSLFTYFAINSVPPKKLHNHWAVHF